uniref:MAX network transcriptional repressor n=1 Tax=Sinocyclocheilus grahami TaxID=75366 RepID=A0A672SSC3_SINGR
MSIETLLEAAKFLELQALQQQKAREENELQERRRREQESEKRRAEVNSHTQPIRINHVTWVEESGPEHRHIPAPAQPPPPPPTMPITVIPIPVVSSTSPTLPPPPTTALSPSAAPRLTPPRKDTHSLPNQQALHQCPLISSQVKAEPTSLSQSNGNKPAQQLQTYLGSIVTASQHALLPQPGPPSAQPSPAVRSSPPDDHRNLDGKKRPGGAGTREVHNKLEKNRRAHLKECFETLKKNIPHVDEKKTSNLSVLRSALRYIQVRSTLPALIDLHLHVHCLLYICISAHLLLPLCLFSSFPHSRVRHVPCHGHMSSEHMARQAQAPNGPASAPAAQVVTPLALPPPQTHVVTVASLQPSVIAHAGSASHASVIQTVNRLAPGPQSISHITVAHLPAIYSQPVTVTQPAVMSHIAQTLSHSQMNGTSVTSTQAAVVGKQMPVGAQMVNHHPQLVGQTVLNPVTMVTMPSFPVSTLKLA